MITYNQDRYIKQSLDSAVNQTQLPYEIVICDDHSTDNTWQIILQYRKKHSDLIRAFRNESNIGLYANYEKVKSYCNGNTVCFLAGDDLYSLDAIEILYKSIISNNLNPDHDKFIIVTNNYLLYPNGAIREWNNYKIKDVSPLKSRIRGDLSYRGFGISKELLDTCMSTLEIINTFPDIKYGVDTIKGINEIINCERFIFCDRYTNYYRTGVGVTSAGDAHDPHCGIELYRTLLNKYLYLWDNDDLSYFHLMVCVNTYKANPTLRNFTVAFYQYFKNIHNFSFNNNRIHNLKNMIPKGAAQFLKKYIYPVALRFRAYIR